MELADPRPRRAVSLLLKNPPMADKAPIPYAITFT